MAISCLKKLLSAMDNEGLLFPANPMEKALSHKQFFSVFPQNIFFQFLVKAKSA